MATAFSIAVSVSTPADTNVASAAVNRLTAIWRIGPRVRGAFSNRRSKRWRPAAERPASTPSTTSTVHSSVTPRAIQPMMMEAFTYPKEPAVKLPVRPWYTSTNTGRITMTVNSRIADMTHSSAAG